MRAKAQASTRHRRPLARGFTLVEVVIAIALTAMIVLAVTAVTRASAQTAQRVKTATADESKLAVALNLIRRDLAGWYEPPRSAQRANPAPHDPAAGEVLLSFETLADSLAPSQGAQATPKRTSLRVEYLLCPRGDAYDLVRRERSSSGTMDLTLVTSNEPIKLEIHDGTAWQAKWAPGVRPKAVRLTLGPTPSLIGS
ncbi:MAG: hypothetical protein AMXMBFR7_50350 [Planctomycetota bacterium]